ncbi:MAG TPA: hypothetical protein VF185_04740 [Patescibacteria group bacterium]
MQEGISSGVVDVKLIAVEQETLPISEYRQTLIALNHTGILSILPVSEKLGVIGVDGKEYPAPTQAEVREIFDRNHRLIETKKAQGFTRLQLTPLATPISLLIARAEREIVRHADEGKIFQTKKLPSDSETPTRVDRNEPVWIWSTAREAIKASDGIVYFPKQFDGNHKGKTKMEVISDPKICPIPGWSVGLVEDTPVLPQAGHGVTTSGRKQLETNLSPKDYIKALQGSVYKGETGWTYEDILTDFLVNLHNTNQVSNEYYENSAVWLVGSYLPGSAFVPYSSWDRGDGQLVVNAYDPGVQNENLGVRSTVRLGL